MCWKHLKIGTHLGTKVLPPWRISVPDDLLRVILQCCADITKQPTLTFKLVCKQWNRLKIQECYLERILRSDFEANLASQFKLHKFNPVLISHLFLYLLVPQPYYANSEYLASESLITLFKHFPKTNFHQHVERACQTLCFMNVYNPPLQAIGVPSFLLHYSKELLEAREEKSSFMLSAMLPNKNFQNYDYSTQHQFLDQIPIYFNKNETGYFTKKHLMKNGFSISAIPLKSDISGIYASLIDCLNNSGVFYQPYPVPMTEDLNLGIRHMEELCGLGWTFCSSNEIKNSVIKNSVIKKHPAEECEIPMLVISG